MKTRRSFWPLALLTLIASIALGQPGVFNSPLVGNNSYVVNVTAAPSDGLDDTLSVQTAINQVHARGGGKVVFSRPGTYNYTAMLCTGGSTPTAPHTTLNSALVVYDNTVIESVPGVIHKLGLVKDDSKCYLIRNADPTNGNSNIVLDGGTWDGGGIIEECTAPTATTFRIPGNYASRLGSGVSFNVSNAAGKVSFTAVSAAYSAPYTTVTITALDAARAIVAITPGAAGTGFIQFANAADVTALYPAGSTVTIAGNAGSGADGSYVISSSIYNVGGDTKTRVYFTSTIPATADDGALGTSSCGAKLGGFQSSWQASVALQPAAATFSGSTLTITTATDYSLTPYFLAPGSQFYVYGNSSVLANRQTPYTIATISTNGSTTTITTTGAFTGSPANASGNIAFVFNKLWYQDGGLFNNVTGLQIKNTKSQGWDKYSWWLVNCNRFTFSDNEFNNGSDGFHVGGLCKNGVIRNTKGRCLDNMIPLVTSEVYYRPALYATTQGAISNVLIDGFFCDSSIGVNLEPIRFTGKCFDYDSTITAVLTGAEGTGYFAIAGDYTTIFTSGSKIDVIGNVSSPTNSATNANGSYVISTSTPPAYNVGSDGRTRIYVTRSISAAVTATGQLSLALSDANSYAITDCTIRGGRGVVGAGYAIRLGDDLASGYGLLSRTPMKRITIQDIAMSAPAGYAIVNISGSGVKDVSVDKIRVTGNRNPAVHVLSPTGAVRNTLVDRLVINDVGGLPTRDDFIKIAANVKYFTLSNSIIVVDGDTGTTEERGATPAAVSGMGFRINQGLSAAEGQIYHGSITNCVFEGAGTTNGCGPLINCSQTTLLSQLSIINCTFRQSRPIGCTYFQVAGPVNMELSNSFINGDQTGATFLYLSNTAARLRLSGSGVKLSKAKNYPEFNYASALNFAYTDIDFFTTTTGAAQLNVSNPDIPLAITSSPFATSVASTIPVSGDCFYNIAAYTAGSTGSPGAGKMIFNADNSAAGGAGGTSGFWALVTPPKPVAVTTTTTTTISAYHSGMTFTNAGGSTVTTTYTLPAAKIGMSLTFVNAAGNTTTINRAGSDTIQDPVSGATTDTSVTTTATGGVITLKCTSAAIWSIQSIVGAFTMILPEYGLPTFDRVYAFDPRRLVA